jgi:thiamine pyrophosphate-dependent acetolactate synthase large subunit-like protein
MTRQEALTIFARYRGESPAITGPSFGGRVLYTIDHRPATLYNMELAYPTAMFLGLALCLPSERVFVIEGDGSMLAGLSVLTTIGRYRPHNLVVIVMDNHAYVTTGSIPTATANANGTDLVAIAKGAGIEKAFRATEPGAFEQYMKRSVSEDGPFFIVADVGQEDMASIGKSKAMPFDIVESSLRFRRTLEERGLVPPIWAV